MARIGLAFAQIEGDAADAGIGRVGCNDEAKLLAHLQHAGVLGKNKPVELLEPLAFAVVDQMLHEAPTETAAFEVRTYQDGVLGPGVVRVSDHPDHAKQSMAALIN